MCVRCFMRSVSPCLRRAGGGDGAGDFRRRAVGYGCADAVTLSTSQSPLFLATDGLNTPACHISHFEGGGKVSRQEAARVLVGGE